MKELERDNRELRRANEIGGSADPEERGGFFRGGARPPLAEVITYIDEQRW